MPSISPCEPDRLSRIAQIAPIIRGALARASRVEGRPDRVVLERREGPARGAPTLRSVDPDEVAKALSGGARRAFVPGLGVFAARKRASAGGELEGQVALVTGGAGGLGLSIAEGLRAAGAQLALLDLAGEEAKRQGERLGGIGLGCDVTNPLAVEEAVNHAVARFGGVDILVSNAGAAHQGALLELEDERFREAFALNFWGHHYAARAAVKVMRRQGTGGALVFNVSKQAVNPGPGLGAYGAPKAALMALMRQYALEHGSDGITSNAINADRIRTGLMTERMVEERSQARGLTPDQYMRGNLLRREVTGKDVAEAVVHLARARASTGAVLSVDGGNVAAMMR